ncbi:disulfide bond formation protein B [Orbaceae bacterium ac157xtp]
MFFCIKKELINLRTDFWRTLYIWQNQRWLWLTGALIALSLDLIAIFYFQDYLQLNPCEKCVVIRLAVLVIFFAMGLCAINPKNRILKIVSYLLLSWAIIQGFLWSFELDAITREFNHSGFSYCTITTVKFPFNLPLDQWFPSIFLPTGICGEDMWYFLGFNMAQYMMLIFAIYFILLFLFIISVFKKGKETA